MRPKSTALPMILLAVSLPLLSAQAEVPSARGTHRTQAVRAGRGEPRVREAVSDRAATLRAPGQAQAHERTRAYQAPKVGEGTTKR